MKVNSQEKSEKNKMHFGESNALIDLLCSLIEHRDLSDLGHISRIRQYTLILLTAISKYKKEQYPLTKEEIQHYVEASTLHDIGKSMIPDYILLKQGLLTEEERETIKLHSVKGAEMIKKLKGFLDSEQLRICSDICKYHHERWDGLGYPEGLKGEEIPFGARVVALVDVYDALTSAKPYKPRLPHKTAVEMITNGDCGMFDPEILECFKLVKNKFNKINAEAFGKF